MRRLWSLTVSALLLLTAAGTARAAPSTWLLVVSGIGGDEAHRKAFVDLSLEMIDAAVDRYGLAPEKVRYLAERIELAPERVDGRSTRDRLAGTIREVATAASAGDQVIVVLIGHGSAQGSEARFNLPGPDIGPVELDAMLAPLAEQRVAVVNTASSSGGFLPELAADGRVVITATRDARQRDETRFPAHFVAAYTSGAADTDKDGGISLLEAFTYAIAEVSREYERGGMLMTEHALLEDDGDGEGSQEPDPATADGALARRIVLGGLVAGAEAPDDPELARLRERRAELESRLEELRSRREEMEEEAYLERLEALLVEIAEVDRSIREIAGEGT